MSVRLNQSAIAEVRDQMSLDFADGVYLNVVTQNLGLERPLIGFSDDIWRAVAKQIGIEYKQILTQFHKVMEIIFGPQTTQAGTLKVPIQAGDTSCVLNDTSNFPQIGTIVVDEGLPSEERRNYCWIDRTENRVYLDGEEYNTSFFTVDHDANDFDIETPILALNGDLVVVAYAMPFPVDELPATVILGRGTPAEEVLAIENVDRASRTLTLETPPTNTHLYARPTNIYEELVRDVYLPSSFVLLEDTTQFPAEGVIRLEPTNTFEVASDVTPATNRVITVAAGTFVEDSMAGFEVVFTSGTSIGRRRRIISNTSDSITVDRDWPVAGPLVGDDFRIFPIVGYSSNVQASGQLNLLTTLDLNTSVTTWDIPDNSKVELLEAQATVSLAPVKCPGSTWEIAQVTPGLVEIIIPDELGSDNDLRSASYLHVADESWTPVSSIGVTPAQSTSMRVSQADHFPRSGTIDLVAEQISYTFPVALLLNSLSPGDTTVVLSNTELFGSGGYLILDPGTSSEEILEFNVNDLGTDTITLLDPVQLFHKPRTHVRSATQLVFSRPLSGGYAPGSPVAFYAPVYAGTDVIQGRPDVVSGTWQGPYMYELGTPAPTGLSAQTVVDSAIAPGPLVLSMTQEVSATAVEVEDATAVFDYHRNNGDFPIVVGSNVGASETTRVDSVALRSRTYTTTTANIGIGDLLITVADFGSVPQGGEFPDALGYRIVVNEAEDGGEEREVFRVVGRSGSSFVIESPATKAHTFPKTVRLVRDVIETDTVLLLNHDGLVPWVERSTATESTAGRAYFPVLDETAYSTVEQIAPQIDTISLDDATGLDPSEGRVILNFGVSSLPVESTLTSLTAPLSTVLTVADGSQFPEYYPYVITVGKGRRYVERLLVTDKPAANQLEVEIGTLYEHAAGEVIEFEPGYTEVLEYDDINANNLGFSTDIMLNYTHYPSEAVIDSSVDSEPRDTGYDYPFRMPDALLTRLEYLIETIRAAGIEVVLIEAR